MRMSIEPGALAAYVTAQLNTFFPDDDVVAVSEIAALLGVTLQRAAHAFSHVERKYFFEDGQAVFNHRNSDQYAMFLYLLANQAHREGVRESIREKLFLLNKALHAVDAFYSIELPPVFLFVHPVGTVLGKASYGDYFVVYQNCSVGADEDGVYPILGDGVVMYSRSAIIGRCRLGDDVVLGAGAFVLHEDVESRTTVVGQSPHLRRLPNPNSVRERKFSARSSQA